ncbi:hypothetical protein T06_9010 [Trichinella sp. T6]|nr:hypothetical protein T06_9010 [Trichinella sp. T6]
MREEIVWVTELGAEMDARREEGGEEVFRVCKIRKPFKGRALVADTGKLYLLIRLTFLLG